MAEENKKTNPETNPEDKGQEEKTYTQAEVDELLQKEGDRRVTEALKKQEKKLKEAEKLAQMNEDDKRNFILEQREAAVAEKEHEFALLENKNEASKVLADKGLSLSLVDFVVAEDAETMKSNIDLLDKAFKQSVKDEVEKRLNSTAPKKNLPPDEAMTKEKFKKMSLYEKQALKNDNPELYKQLTKR